MSPNIETVNILGVHFANLTSADLLTQVSEALAARKKFTVFFTSVNSVNCCYHTKGYREVLNSASVVTPDSYGILLAARIMGRPFKEQKQISTDYFMVHLLPWMNEQEVCLFLVGSTEDVNLKARQNIQRQYHRIRVLGGISPFGDLDELSSATVLEAINNANPDVVLVSFGNPKQEQWIARCASRLNAPIIMNAGGFLDYLAGSVPYAPPIFHRLNLVWLFRLCIQPWKMWKRYIIGNPLFILRVIKARVM
jgi:exopolysaccharide biosynthesis WecB/TagA/CpsF family protein